MVKDKVQNGLLVDKLYSQVLSEKCSSEVKDLIDSFAQSYAVKPETNDDEEWLTQEFLKHFPEKDVNELQQYASDIVRTIKHQEFLRNSLQESLQTGSSPKHWFNQQLDKATENMTEDEALAFKKSLQTSLRNVNNDLSLTNEVNDVIENVQQAHSVEYFYVNTFNTNAIERGSIYRARVIENVNADNTIKKEIQIVDTDGNVHKSYDCVYVDGYQRVCENPEQAAADFAQRNGAECESLDFRLEAPDGTMSDILPESPKEDLEEPVSNDNIANRSTVAAMQGVMNRGYEMASNQFKNDDGKVREYAAKAFGESVDTSAKMIVAGALQTASEKGLISALPKDTSSTLIAIIAEMAVSQFSITSDLARGKITKSQALDETTKNVFCSVIGTVASAKGAAIGLAIGTVLGPIGTTIGGLIGGSLGFLIGFNFGNLISGHVNKLRKFAQNAIVSCASKLHEKVVTLASATKRTVSKLARFVGSMTSKIAKKVVNFATIAGTKIGQAANVIAGKVDEANQEILKATSKAAVSAINKVNEIREKVTN